MNLNSSAHKIGSIMQIVNVYKKVDLLSMLVPFLIAFIIYLCLIEEYFTVAVSTLVSIVVFSLLSELGFIDTRGINELKAVVLNKSLLIKDRREALRTLQRVYSTTYTYDGRHCYDSKGKQRDKFIHDGRFFRDDWYPLNEQIFQKAWTISLECVNCTKYQETDGTCNGCEVRKEYWKRQPILLQTDIGITDL